eukprot:11450670-Heterocapsa_arctica.AAC.1
MGGRVDVSRRGRVVRGNVVRGRAVDERRRETGTGRHATDRCRCLRRACPSPGDVLGHSSREASGGTHGPRDRGSSSIAPRR